jgi:fucose 4-O-acetylase-like acetyltransferase
MSREPLIDNAKFIFIFLVVFGHMIQPFQSDLYIIQVLYHWIYLFHMPAFIFLSGFFAKGIGDTDYLLKLCKKLLLPYLIFQLLYSLYYMIIGVKGFQFTIFEPQWSMWFLLSLFSWHLLLVIFKRISPIWGMSLAILIGVGIGYFHEIGHTFSLSRTLVFFPFFLLGYWVTKDDLLKLKSREVKVVSSLVMLLVGIGLFVTPTFSTHWLLASYSYPDIGYPEVGGAVRIGIYFLSFLMTLSVLAWIPRKGCFMTEIGKRTIYVYLLHGFFIHYFRNESVMNVNHVLDIIGLAVVSLTIVLLLASRLVRVTAQPLVEGSWSMIKDRKKARYRRRIRNETIDC